MIRKTLIGAMLLVALVAAPAAAQYAPTVISPGTVVQGSEITISGGGCRPNQPLTLTIYPESPGALAGNPTVAPVLSFPTVADAMGNFTVTFTIPASLAPGWYDVLGPCPPVGTEPGSADQLYYLGRFQVVAPDVRPDGTDNGNGAGAGGGTLPRTGSNLNGVGLLGAGLLTAGGLVLLSTRKRRARSPHAA